MNNKIKYNQLAYNKANKEKTNDRQRYYISCLTDRYIAHRLGIHTADCPPELIELKRAQLRLIRAIKN